MTIRSVTSILLLSSLLATGALADTDKAVVFEEYTAGPGVSFVEERFITTSATGRFTMGSDMVNNFVSRNVYDQEMKVTLLDISPGAWAVAKARVDVIRSFEVKQKPPAQNTPLAGNSYILWIDDTGMDAIAAEQGVTVTEAEKELLRRDFPDLREVSFLPQFLRGRNLKIGDTLNLPVAKAGEMMGFKGGLSVTEMYITLHSTRMYKGEEVAEFSVHTTLRGPVMDGDLTAEVNAAGMLLVETRTSWPVLYRMVGGMRFTPPEGRTDLKLEGVGTVVVNITREYNF